ncbi:MAG TPA: amino acid adenylation domain-containing protein [Bryobacteraceae bacterium]|nr:amino acid adenylation domain-containing protein [Bryobacteraceae bacterium]
MKVHTVAELFQIPSDAPAIHAPGRTTLSHSQLAKQVWSIVDRLRAAGVSRADRVAVVLPNGPEMATAFLGVACAAVCAPLNPGYRRSEFTFFFEDLRPKLLIVQKGVDSPVRLVATELGIPILEITPGIASEACPPAGLPQPNDVALVLHTSGTTSRPKIVPLSHANLCASARNIGRTLALTPQDCCLNVMPLFHIHGLIAALLSSLAAGGSVVCTPGFLAPDFFPWLDAFAPTWYTAVPTIHQGVLARASQHRGVIERRPLRLIRSSSAPLPPSVMSALESVFNAPVIEAYGMTEASHQMASNPLPPAIRKAGSVGLAAGPEIAILAESGTFYFAGPTPPGEIVIRGENVTAGYERNPTANAESWRDGWFRTGDVGSLDGDGYLALTARTKEMINRGGEKIAPREVDEALLRHRAVAQALAFAMPDNLLGEEVAAAVVLHPGASISEAALRDFAAQTLADFKVPRLIVFLDEIPQGPTGKPQRIGLAEKLGIRAETRRPGRARYIPPRTIITAAIAAVWENVLRISAVGEDDDFFACGGDSLLAAVAIARLEPALGKRLPLLSLFDHPVLCRFAEYCEAVDGLPVLEPIARVGRPTPLPASYAQERMWFLAQYEPDTQPYTSTTALRLTGELNREALAKSLRAVMRRHEILRTIYQLRDAQVIQTVLDDPPVPFRIESAPADSLEQVRALATVERTRPFDLARELPFRVVLAAATTSECYLILAMQHIATDGWSKSILVADLAAYYSHYAASVPLELSPLPIQYADYAVWERTCLAPRVFPAQIAWWKRALRGAPALLDLPTDHPRPPRQTFTGDSLGLAIPATLLAQFNEICRGCQATLFMGLLALLNVLLSRYSGMTDIVVGSVIANREQVEAERLIGVFINSLALRTDLSGDPSFPDLLDRVRHFSLAAFENRQVPFAALVEALAPPRSTAHTPLYQVLFQLRNFPSRSAEAAGLAIAEIDLPHSAVSFDFELEATENPEGLGLKLIYNRDLFYPETAGRILAHFRNLMEAVCHDRACPVSRLPLLADAERTRLLATANAAPEPIPADCLPQLFEAVAARQPDHVAARAAGRQWTYAELNHNANRVAHGLGTRGIGPGAIVGVALGRGLELVAALLGVLKSGAAYLPLDPTFPAERLQFMHRDSRMQLVIDNFAAIALPDEAPLNQQNPSSAALADAPAYVLYTSGTTAVPKGTVIPHRALTNLLASMTRILGFTAGDCWLATTTVSFDIAGAELFVPLLAGGTVEIASEGTAADGPALAALLESSGATFWQATPSGWQVLLASGWQGSPRLNAISGGEELRLDLARQIRARVARLWNMYGPTETTIWSTWAEIPADPQSITIGRPFANTRIYILDRCLEPQPTGIPGDLYIAGDGLALGYLHRPELTEERFLSDPFGPPGSRMYRTGDIARFLPNGAIDFRGRADAQVKLRGFRIELEGVETAVASHPAVAAAAAAVHSPGNGDQRLVCYFIPRDAVTPAELRAFLQRSLPDYMIPSRLIEVAEFPQTTNRKLDRRALAASPFEAAATPAFRAPANPIEARLAEICAGLLACDSVSTDADLFDLGAHSLLCATLLARIEQEFTCRIPLPVIFEHPTVEGLAAIVAGRTLVEADPRIVAVRCASAGTPLFWIKADPAFRFLAQRLPGDQPIFGLFLPDNHPLPRPYTIEDAAAFHLETIRLHQPEGPYYLGGFCAAGLVAYEIARRIEAAGEQVAALILIDTMNPRTGRYSGFGARLKHHQTQLAGKGVVRYTSEKTRAVANWLNRRKLDRRIAQGGETRAEALAEEQNPEFLELRFSARRYRPGPLNGRMLLVRRATTGLQRPDFGWTPVVPNLDVLELQGPHLGFFFEPQVTRLAEAVSDRLRGAAEAQAVEPVSDLIACQAPR